MGNDGGDQAIVGIYAIRNTINGKVYIGKSVNIHQRWKHHRNKLRARRHTSRHLQQAWSKYGEQAFCFEVIELVQSATPLILAEREGHWVAAFKASDKNHGYNIAVIDPNGTVMASPETRLRLRLSHLGKKQAPEAVAKTAAAHRGMKRSSVTVARIRAANLGQVATKEQCAKLSTAKTGKPLSDEHRNKIQAAFRGNVVTAVERQQIANRARAGENRQGLAQEFGVSQSYISMLKRGTLRDNRGAGRTLHLVAGMWVTEDSESSAPTPEL